MLNQGAWSQVPEVKAWIEQCRLYAVNHLLAGVKPEDNGRREMLGRFAPLSMAAIENIPKILANE